MAEFIFQENGPLGLAMKDEDWYVVPGDKITIPALVANRGSEDIFVELSVHGVPIDWVTLDNPVVHLGPNQKHEIAPYHFTTTLPSKPGWQLSGEYTCDGPEPYGNHAQCNRQFGHSGVPV